MYVCVCVCVVLFDRITFACQPFMVDSVFMNWVWKSRKKKQKIFSFVPHEIRLSIGILLCAISISRREKKGKKERNSVNFNLMKRNLCVCIDYVLIFSWRWLCSIYKVLALPSNSEEKSWKVKCRRFCPRHNRFLIKLVKLSSIYTSQHIWYAVLDICLANSLDFDCYFRIVALRTSFSR